MLSLKLCSLVDSLRLDICFGLYSVIRTVTEFTATSNVRAVDLSTFFKRAGHFLCLFRWRDAFFDVEAEDAGLLVVPFGTPEAPGRVVAC